MLYPLYKSMIELIHNEHSALLEAPIWHPVTPPLVCRITSNKLVLNPPLVLSRQRKNGADPEIKAQH